MRNALIVCLFAFAVVGIPSGKPPVALVEPSAEMRESVQPVVRVASRMSIVDRLWLQHIYSNTAKVVEVDGEVGEPVVTSLSSLRAVHVAVLKFVWRGLADNKPNKYEGLSKAIDSAIESALGAEEGPMTPELRKKAVEVYEAIAWAGLGKDG